MTKVALDMTGEIFGLNDEDDPDDINIPYGIRIEINNIKIYDLLIAEKLVVKEGTLVEFTSEGLERNQREAEIMRTFFEGDTIAVKDFLGKVLSVNKGNPSEVSTANVQFLYTSPPDERGQGVMFTLEVDVPFSELIVVDGKYPSDGLRLQVLNLGETLDQQLEDEGKK